MADLLDMRLGSSNQEIMRFQIGSDYAIAEGGGSSNVTINGEPVSGDFELNGLYYDTERKNQLSVQAVGEAVMLNGEIYVLSNRSGMQGVYKYNTTTNDYELVASLPSYIGLANFPKFVAYDNAIHLFGGANHYKLENGTWVLASIIPYSFWNGQITVHENEIHIFGTNTISSNYVLHYKWNGTSWTSVSTLPYPVYGGFALSYDGKIGIFGGQNQYYDEQYASEVFTSTKMCEYSNGIWEVGELPPGVDVAIHNSYYATSAYATIFYGKPTLVGGSYDIYQFNGSTWQRTLPRVATLEQFVIYGLVQYKGEIFVACGYRTGSASTYYSAAYYFLYRLEEV